MMKRLLLVWLAMMLLGSSIALAEESIEIEENGPDRVSAEITNVEPRYTHLLYMTAGLEIDENGHVIYGGSARAIGYRIRLTLYLQQSNNGLFWDNIVGTIKTSAEHVQKEMEKDLTPGDYFYRAKVIAEVLDSDGNVLETATGYSSEERY